jgi:hypothetical protein
VSSLVAVLDLSCLKHSKIMQQSVVKKLVLVHHNFCARSYHFSIEKSLYVSISECSSHVLLGINWVDHLSALNNTPTVVYDYLFCSCINHCGFACSSLMFLLYALFSSLALSSNSTIFLCSRFYFDFSMICVRIGMNMATHKHRIKKFMVRISRHPFFACCFITCYP